MTFFPASAAYLPKGDNGRPSTLAPIRSAEDSEDLSGENMRYRWLNRVRHGAARLGILIAPLVVGAGASSVAGTTEPGVTTNGVASLEPAADFYVDPATGIVYRQVRRTVERQVLETEVEKREATVYRPEVVVDVRPETRTIREPVVSYVWEPRVINRWNPLSKPTVRYEHVPKTHWESRDETVQHRETRTNWVAENRQVEVPKAVMKIHREEKLEYEAVGRMPPEPGYDTTALSQAVETRLRPIRSPLGNPQFLPAPALAQSALGGQITERSREQVGMRATELQPTRFNPLISSPGFDGLARQPRGTLLR